MNINIRGENLEVTGALREYVEKKLNRLERYLDIPPETDAHVTLRVQRDKQYVEVTIPLRGGAVLRAEVKHADMYASIDLVVDKLEGQIRKHKTKANRKFNKGGIRNLFVEQNEKTSATYSEEEDE